MPGKLPRPKPSTPDMISNGCLLGDTVIMMMISFLALPEER